MHSDVASTREICSLGSISSQVSPKVDKGSTTTMSTLRSFMGNIARKRTDNPFSRLLIGAATLFACMVMTSVFCFAHEFKIADSIVIRDSINVMDDFSFNKESSNFFFHNKPMLSDVSAFIPKWMVRRVNEDVSRIGNLSSGVEIILDREPVFSSESVEIDNMAFSKPSDVFSWCATNGKFSGKFNINRGFCISRDIVSFHVVENEFFADAEILGNFHDGFGCGVNFGYFFLGSEKLLFGHVDPPLFVVEEVYHQYEKESNKESLRYSLNFEETQRSQDKELGDNMEMQISKMGDTVIIRTVPTVTINSYVKGQKLSYENLESANIELVVDKGKSFSFACDDVDKYQSDLKLLNEWSTDAGQQMNIAIDSDVLNAVDADASADNVGTTAGVKSGAFNLGVAGAPVGITKTNVLDYLVYCGSVLSEQSVPIQNRWIVIPEWMKAWIQLSDLKDVSMTGDSKTPIRNGLLGELNNFRVYVSNNYTSVADAGGQTAYNILFGHKSAITFASQITKTETLRNPDTFGDLIRGLNVYGYEVVVPKALGVLYAYKA